MKFHLPLQYVLGVSLTIAQDIQSLSAIFEAASRAAIPSKASRTVYKLKQLIYIQTNNTSTHMRNALNQAKPHQTHNRFPQRPSTDLILFRKLWSEILLPGPISPLTIASISVFVRLCVRV